MYEVTNWTFGETEVRTIERDGEPWWVLKDVCAVLEIKNHKEIPDRLESDEVGRFELPHPQNPEKSLEMVCINESGLYSVILRSDKPQSKPFRKWVTSEVLPSIRKTGSYKIKNADPIKEKRLEIMEMNAKAKQAKVMLEFAKLGLSSESKELLASNAVEIMTGKRLLPLPTTEKTYSAGEVGKILGISANMVGRIANANNLKTDEYGITVLDAAKNGKQIPNFRYNDAGIERLKEIIG